eukprot:4249814-Karenia_brevis.AAC.1
MGAEGSEEHQPNLAQRAQSGQVPKGQDPQGHQGAGVGLYWRQQEVHWGHEKKDEWCKNEGR